MTLISIGSSKESLLNVIKLERLVMRSSPPLESIFIFKMNSNLGIGRLSKGSFF